MDRAAEQETGPSVAFTVAELTLVPVRNVTSSSG